MIELLLLLGFVQLTYQAEEHDFMPKDSQNRFIKAAVTYINQPFSGNINQIVPEKGSNNEISGCTFTNIVNSGINNFIKIQGPTLFNNNVIQSDNYLQEQPGVIWLNADINFVLVNCSFIKHRTRSTDDGIILTVNDNNSPTITFESCKFIDCSDDATRSLVKLRNKQPTVNFTDCLFTFSDSSKSCQVLYAMSPNTVFDRCNFSGCGPNAINLDIKEATLGGQFKFTKNDVKTVRKNFLTMASSIATIEMNDNTFTDVALTDEYFIHINSNLKSLTLHGNTFSEFTTRGANEMSCGGIATFVQNPSQGTSAFTLVYEECTFVNIKNERTNGASSYGGALQFGFSSSLNSLHVTINSCVFKGNKALKHGGALAIQTSGKVIIKNCTFENNVANSKQSSLLNLLGEKEEGRGGALYLNALFKVNSNTRKMESATIEDCKFIKNVAFGGYAIYIDGNSDTTFTITSNKFFNNYGENSAEQSKHGAIDSETLSISIVKIENENEFSVIENGSGSKLLVHVDENGIILPDPTATPRATQPPTPAPIDGTSPDYIDKYFEGQNYTSQIQLGTSNIKQISGCTFKNILKPDGKPEMNNFIQVLGESSFFNNVVEYDEIRTDQPAVFWLNKNITFTISHCKFTRVTHRVGSDDANILTVDNDNRAIVTFDSCEFIECAYSHDESLVKLKNKDPTITFTDCVITFGQTGCQIVQAMNPQVVFERCEITGSVSNAINLASIPDDNTLKGVFKFNNNIVKKQTNNFINIKNLKSVPQINNNLFEDVTLNNEYMIYIENDQKKFKLAFNTFSRITTSADSETYGGGFSCYMPTSAKNSATSTLSITYENCNFNDIKNLNSKKPYHQGGAVQCGFNKDFCNLDLYITNCVFKGNQAFKHGGALAVQIQGSLTIQNTTFEENRANCNTNAKLLAFHDYTDNKVEGRGGAIYLNPTFAVEGDDEKSMVKVIINNCTFKRNVAFDGYAIYIEGENGAKTTYTFTNNFFINNYNGHDSSQGGIIVSEITTITEDQIINSNNNNVFSNKDNGLNASTFVYVDHSGLPFPDPTMTPLPTNSDGSNSEIWKQEENVDKRVEVEKDPSNLNEQNVVLKVEATKFESMNELNGSAIHLVNCGLECKNNCEFISLGQEGSVGGAIYIHNPNEFKNSVSLEKLFFKSCIADYGGAVYIYSSSINNLVSIKSCTFQENKAKENIDPTNDFAGGSAIFLMANRGVILSCRFKSNTGAGGSVKMVGIYQSDSNAASVLHHESSPKVQVKDCFFSVSESAIFYLASSESDSKVEVCNCVFTGKLPKDGHYIDGLLVNKKAPKMVVRSCKFVEKDFEKVVAKNSLFAAVDQKSIVLGYSEMEREKEESHSSWMLYAGMAAAALVAVVAFFLVRRFRNSIENDEQLRDDELIVSEATI